MPDPTLEIKPGEIMRAKLSQQTVEWIVTLTLFIACMMILGVVTAARSGEIVQCAPHPESGRWVYRNIDERKCWFPAGPGIRRGEDKPKSELVWGSEPSPHTKAQEPGIPPDANSAPVAPEIANPTIMLEETNEFDLRWKGER